MFTIEDLERILASAEDLSSEAAYKLARGEGSTVPCPFPECRLSAAEHHRLAYGFLNELKNAKRRIKELENNYASLDLTDL